MGLFSKPEDLTDADYQRARLRMVETQLAKRNIADQSVLEAMRRVLRHRFVPDDYQREAYDDSPLPIGNDQTISQPYVVGSMTEALHPGKNKRALEIGTGSGYQTAILAELFESVVTVEYFADLSGRAQAILSDLGYKNIEYHIGDGLSLPENDDCYDAIMVTAAPKIIPPELINRLAVGGRMIIPVGEMIQYLKLVVRDEDGEIDIRTMYQVRFVPLQ
ncbi:MAG: protein-L-isoaspartate(D-aspartate) O-methyltransferase [FCB group bacterium]|nr:protein-L-isoaspartate(D-aspartate) O-methyltransferase [FCB group bacterium]